MRYIKKYENTNQELLDQELIAAVKSNDLKKLKKAIKDGANVNTPINKRILSPLYYCANSMSKGDNSKIIRELIKAGANVDIQDDDGNTPLILAAFKLDDETNKEEIINRYKELQELIKGNADWNIVDDEDNDFFRYLDNYKEKIIKEFPKKYKEYLTIKAIRQDEKKYNL